MEHRIRVWGAPKLPSDLEPCPLSGALLTCVGNTRGRNTVRAALGSEHLLYGVICAFSIFTLQSCSECRKIVVTGPSVSPAPLFIFTELHKRRYLELCIPNQDIQQSKL